MLKFNCLMCKKELTEPGALLIGPPELIENDMEQFYAGLVSKNHICRGCYEVIMLFIEPLEPL